MASSNGFDTRIDIPASRIELVLGEIRKAILTRRIKPGEQLVESELARIFGVSKTPVREALKILSSSGLVTFRPYKGAAVRSIDSKYVRDVYDLRIMLEPEAVKRSTENIEPARLEFATNLLSRARQVGENGELGDLSLLNRSFHSELYAHCGSELLIDMLDNLRDRAALVSVVAWETAPTWEHEWQQHRDILDAVQQRDGELAKELVRKHIQGFLNEVLSYFQD